MRDEAKVKHAEAKKKEFVEKMRRKAERKEEKKGRKEEKGTENENVTRDCQEIRKEESPGGEGKEEEENEEESDDDLDELLMNLFPKLVKKFQLQSARNPRKNMRNRRK